MGASLVYLDKPNKEIIFEEGESDKMRYVAGDMQGWRINMVSTHSILPQTHPQLKASAFIIHGEPNLTIS